MNEKFCILINISLKFVPKGPIDNTPALVSIMDWSWIGDKQLSETMLIRFACGTRGRWVKNIWSCYTVTSLLVMPDFEYRDLWNCKLIIQLLFWSSTLYIEQITNTRLLNITTLRKNVNIYISMSKLIIVLRVDNLSPIWWFFTNKKETHRNIFMSIFLWGKVTSCQLDFSNKPEICIGHLV